MSRGVAGGVSVRRKVTPTAAEDRLFIRGDLSDAKKWPFVVEVDELLYNLCTTTTPLLRLPNSASIETRTQITQFASYAQICLKCGFRAQTPVEITAHFRETANDNTHKYSGDAKSGGDEKSAASGAAVATATATAADAKSDTKSDTKSDVKSSAKPAAAIVKTSGSKSSLSWHDKSEERSRMAAANLRFPRYFYFYHSSPRMRRVVYTLAREYGCTTETHNVVLKCTGAWGRDEKWLKRIRITAIGEPYMTVPNYRLALSVSQLPDNTLWSKDAIDRWKRLRDQRNSAPVAAAAAAAGSGAGAAKKKSGPSAAERVVSISALSVLIAGYLPDSQTAVRWSSVSVSIRVIIMLHSKRIWPLFGSASAYPKPEPAGKGDAKAAAAAVAVAEPVPLWTSRQQFLTAAKAVRNRLQKAMLVTPPTHAELTAVANAAAAAKPAP